MSPSPSFTRLRRFRDLHRGQRAVIVCNGPSLNRMDLSPLRHEIVFGLNKIHLGLDRFGFYPRYLVAVNARVIEQAETALREMTAIKFLSDRAAGRFSEDGFTYFIRTRGLTGRFYSDIVEGVREGHTVTHAALQIAFYMGFAEVVIVGMDHRFDAAGAPNAPLQQTGPDLNHFSPDYFRGHTWDAPNLEESATSYRAAKAAFEADGRRVLDATMDGACDIFEKVDYKNVL